MWMQELNDAILAELNRRTWTTRADLVAAVGKHVSPAYAIPVFNARVGRKEARSVKIRIGRIFQVSICCIFFSQSGRIESRGKGESKAYRLKAT